MIYITQYEKDTYEMVGWESRIDTILVDSSSKQTQAKQE